MIINNRYTQLNVEMSDIIDICHDFFMDELDYNLEMFTDSVQGFVNGMYYPCYPYSDRWFYSWSDILAFHKEQCNNGYEQFVPYTLMEVLNVFEYNEEHQAIIF